MNVELRRPHPDEIDQAVGLSGLLYPDRPEERSLWEKAAEDQAPAVVAAVGGEVVGYVSARPEPGLAPTICRIGLGVAVPYRRRGVGSSLLGRILTELPDCTEVRIRVPDSATDALEFLRRRDFREHQRMLRLVQDLTAIPEPAVASLPDGIVITTLAEELPVRPDCLQAVHALQSACFLDIPSGDSVILPPIESFLDVVQSANVPHDGFFLAKAGDRYVGLSYVGRFPNDPESLSHRLTGVDRAFRGRGVATALKHAVTRYAMARGYRRVITHTLEVNRPMRAVNASLGFRQAYAEVRLRLLLEPGARR
jgi:GNAT superfamily N-acetyltransferase